MSPSEQAQKYPNFLAKAAGAGSTKVLEQHFKYNKNDPYINSIFKSNNELDKPYIGRTPLCLAIEKGHTDVAKILLANGANRNSPDKEGKTPLHFAIENGKSDIAKILLDKGADPNALDKQGHTPLDFAMTKCPTKQRAEAITILFSYGALNKTQISVSSATPPVMSNATVLPPARPNTAFTIAIPVTSQPNATALPPAIPNNPTATALPPTRPNNIAPASTIAIPVTTPPNTTALPPAIPNNPTATPPVRPNWVDRISKTTPNVGIS
jgi:hypothetical protein